MPEQNDEVQIKYNGQDILVSKKVADFLEQDRKKMAALGRSDRRHLIIINPDETLGLHRATGSPVEYQVIKNLFFEKLRETVIELDDTEKMLIDYRFNDSMTLSQIGSILGISKTAVYIRLKKLAKKMGNSVLA